MLVGFKNRLKVGVAILILGNFGQRITGFYCVGLPPSVTGHDLGPEKNRNNDGGSVFVPGVVGKGQEQAVQLETVGVRDINRSLNCLSPSAPTVVKDEYSSCPSETRILSVPSNAAAFPAIMILEPTRSNG